MEGSQSVKRSSTISESDVTQLTSELPRVARSMSADYGETADGARMSKFSGYIKRRSFRRRPSKRLVIPEKNYGHDSATYEAIRQRVLQERAVTNAIEALHERWNMLMFRYEDCTTLNEERKKRRLMKLNVKRQMELITIVTLFLVACLPIVVVMFIACR
ncbi:hypothetical protein DPMN_090320 [Dreissena polymorpha]|uniref:Transmembrane protein n=1 Tax=Dreissena polymorpha TaxID=45954 RepID=A0A9D4KYI4_DREPO|nr:hypothetical protein DPMN_090320 [Dreissena polymorpha]